MFRLAGGRGNGRRMLRVKICRAAVVAVAHKLLRVLAVAVLVRGCCAAARRGMRSRAMRGASEGGEKHRCEALQGSEWTRDQISPSCECGARPLPCSVSSGARCFGAGGGAVDGRERDGYAMAGAAAALGKTTAAKERVSRYRYAACLLERADVRMHAVGFGQIAVQEGWTPQLRWIRDGPGRHLHSHSLRSLSQGRAVTMPGNLFTPVCAAFPHGQTPFLEPHCGGCTAAMQGRVHRRLRVSTVAPSLARATTRCACHFDRLPRAQRQDNEKSTIRRHSPSCR